MSDCLLHSSWREHNEDASDWVDGGDALNGVCVCVESHTYFILVKKFNDIMKGIIWGNKHSPPNSHKKNVTENSHQHLMLLCSTKFICKTMKHLESE
jgi:hypothetical protein